MSVPAHGDQVSLTRLTRPRPSREVLAEDVRRGLTGSAKSLPPIHFYDARGSELFERITELDEYYPTDTEAEILRSHASDLVAAIGPHELLELGSGASTKTTLLLDALAEAGGRRYAALEISESALSDAAHRLAAAYPWLEVDGYVGDFHHDLPSVPRDGRRLIAFLGSTLGNLEAGDRGVLMGQVAASLEPDDGFLLGVDLVKSPDILVPAYDDPAGVTAEFNRNVLHVINRDLAGDLPVDDFEHRAVWDPVGECMEMHLVASCDIHAHLRAIDLDLRFARGEHIVTEHSCKFHVEVLGRELAAAGLHVERTVTDSQDWFAVVLATKS